MLGGAGLVLTTFLGAGLVLTTCLGAGLVLTTRLGAGLVLTTHLGAGLVLTTCLGVGLVLTTCLRAGLVFKEAFLCAIHVILYTLSEARHFLIQAGCGAPANTFQLLNITSKITQIL